MHPEQGDLGRKKDFLYIYPAGCGTIFPVNTSRDARV